MNKSVAIIGDGWVGKSMQKLFPDGYIYVRSLKPEHANTRHTNDKSLINDCDIAFICVPSPSIICYCACHEQVAGANCRRDNGLCGKCDLPFMTKGGEGILDTSIIEEIIAWCQCPLIVIRSTVNPGDCDEWSTKYNKNIVFQPEYLGETPDHPLINEKKTPFIILGGTPENTRQVIDLYATVYNANTKIRQVSLLEAEIIKLSENRAIAFKVAECQELYDACRSAGVDYYTIRDAVYGDDPRFNLWWTFVYPDKRGFNSKCIPKDIYAWCAFAESVGCLPKITRAILERNKEWIA